MQGNMSRAITGDDVDVSSLGSDERGIRKANIAAGRAVGELVRTTLGPRGMDKLLVDDTGMGIVTNNGASILREMVDHPVGDLVTDVAVKQEDDVHDGTTTAAVVAGALLGEADELIDRDVHPTNIATGYLAAVERGVDVLERNAVAIDPTDTDRLIDIANTAMAGKSVNADAEIPALVVEALRTVATEEGADEDYVTVEKITGGQVADSHLTDGVIVDKDRADAATPYRIEDATIAVIDKPVEVRELEGESTVHVTTPSDVDRLYEGERAEATALVDHLEDLGVDVVVCGENVDDLPRSVMADRGIYTTRRVDDDELRFLARAVGANVVSAPREASAADLGHADVVEESDIGGERKTNVRGCATDATATLVLYGSTNDVVDEVHRAVEDALAVVGVALTEPEVVPGGGAAETAVALDLRDFAPSHDTREQLAIDAFADALETIPRTLAENAGINPVDGLVDVRAAQSTGTSTAGIDGETGAVVDALDAGIVEPLSVKTRSLEAAAEAAVGILLIDGALPRKSDDELEAGGEGMPGGMGGPGMGPT